MGYSPRGVSAYALTTEENISLVRIESIRVAMTKCSVEGAMRLPYATDIFYTLDESEDCDDTEVSFLVGHSCLIGVLTYKAIGCLLSRRPF